MTDLSVIMESIEGLRALVEERLPKPRGLLMAVAECAEECRMPVRSFDDRYVRQNVFKIMKVGRNARRIRRKDFEKFIETMGTGFNHLPGSSRWERDANGNTLRDADGNPVPKRKGVRDEQ